jgi:magnesium transporter
VKGRMRTKGPDYLMYVLLDTIIENYLVNIEILGEMIEKTEPKIFQKHRIR